MLSETTAPAVVRLPYEEAKAAMGWKQGEHITIIGPTGQGKTTLALDLMNERSYPLIIATKPKDTTLTNFIRRNNYHVIKEWPPVRERTVLWPSIRRVEDKPNQAVQVYRALSEAYTAGGYAILVDELSYVLDELGCEQPVKTIWQQGRSINLSLVTCILRPSHVPLLAYDQATFVILFRDNDERNLRRMGGLAHWSSKEIMSAVSRLNRHEFIILNTREGTMIQSKMENI